MGSWYFNFKKNPMRELVKSLNEGNYYINIYLRKNISLQGIGFLNKKRI